MRLAAIFTSWFSRRATAISSFRVGSPNCSHQRLFASAGASLPWKRNDCGVSTAGRR